MQSSFVCPCPATGRSCPPWPPVALEAAEFGMLPFLGRPVLRDSFVVDTHEPGMGSTGRAIMSCNQIAAPHQGYVCSDCRSWKSWYWWQLPSCCSAAAGAAAAAAIAPTTTTATTMIVVAQYSASTKLVVIQHHHGSNNTGCIQSWPSPRY